MTASSDPSFPAMLRDIPAAEWAAAVISRRSTRTYDGRPLEQEVFESLERFVLDLPARETARLLALRELPEGLFTGILGGYAKVVGAPSALAVIGDSTDPAMQQSAGYLGEAAILQATSLGIDTCWVAGFFDREVAKSAVHLGPTEQIVAVSPLGHGQPRPRAGERFLKRMVGAHKRRPIDAVAPGFDPERWPAWAAEGVRLARVAPSAVNRQPWLFEIEEAHPLTGPPEATGMVISVVERGSEGHVSRLLDCGIAMLHFEVGARLMGVSGSWELLPAPRVARFTVIAPGTVNASPAAS